MRLFEEWKEKELSKELEVRMKLEERRIREDAISRSSSVILGKVGEQLAPVILFSNKGINPKDMRFLGTPVDYVVFEGLSEGKIRRIIFLEVKSGKGKLSPSEREVKRAVEEKRVIWEELYLRSLLL